MEKFSHDIHEFPSIWREKKLSCVDLLQNIVELYITLLFCYDWKRTKYNAEVNKNCDE